MLKMLTNACFEMSASVADIKELHVAQKNLWQSMFQLRCRVGGRYDHGSTKIANRYDGL